MYEIIFYKDNKDNEPVYDKNSSTLCIDDLQK
jgi:hypothetical protein